VFKKAPFSKNSKNYLSFRASGGTFCGYWAALCGLSHPSGQELSFLVQIIHVGREMGIL